MNFVTLVPKHHKIMVTTGMDDLGEQVKLVDHEDAVGVANQWNIGAYHEDVWVKFEAENHWNDIVECDLLYDDSHALVVGFVIKEDSHE